MKTAMKRYIILLMAAVLFAPALRAESKEVRAESPHELSIGVSDRTFARIGYSRNQYDPAPGLWQQTIGQPVEDAHAILQNAEEWGNQRTITLPHFFVEYQYRINSYIGVGLLADLLPERHTYKAYTGYHDYLYSGAYTYYFLYLIPKVRFTFYHHDYVNLYASAGIGAGLALQDIKNQEPYSGAGLAFEATLFGVSIGKKGFFGNVEVFNIGLCPAIKAQPLKLISASIGYRF